MATLFCTIALLEIKNLSTSVYLKVEWKREKKLWAFLNGLAVLLSAGFLEL